MDKQRLILAAITSLSMLHLGCTGNALQETTTTPPPLDMARVEDMKDDMASRDIGNAPEMDLAPDLSINLDANADAGEGDAGFDAGTGGDMAPPLDAGPSEPCQGGVCTPQDCIDNGWVPPGNLRRDTMPLLRDDTVALDWEQFFGQPFPRGNARFLEVEPEHYVAIEFDTFDFQNDGKIVFDNPQAAGPWGSRLITINQCPGYFGPSPYPEDDECREWKFAVGNIDFTIGSDTDSPFDCELEPNRKYYLNIVFVDEILPVGSEDLIWRCAIGDQQRDNWETCGALMESTYVGR